MGYSESFVLIIEVSVSTPTRKQRGGGGRVGRSTNLATLQSHTATVSTWINTHLNNNKNNEYNNSSKK